MIKKDIIKRAQINLLDEFVRICRKYNLKYSLIGGTLLGAIRHNGFIPWDDDIDVGMPRNDYEKFMSLCDVELDDDYAITNWNKDKNSPLPFSKLVIKNTKYIQKMSSTTNANSEIFIDIFPFDNIPDRSYKRFLQKIKVLSLRKIILIKYRYNIFDKGITQKVKHLPFILLSFVCRKQFLKNALEKQMRKYEKSVTMEMSNMAGSYSYEKEIAKNGFFENRILHWFETGQYYIPTIYDDYLKQVYGNYMKLPPISERKGKHKIVKVSLGNYKIK